MRIPERLNYLHYGDALAWLNEADLDADLGQVSKCRLLGSLPAIAQRSRFVNAIIRSYGDPRTKALDVRRLLSDVANTTVAARLFSSLRCRGFSYLLIDDMEWYGESLRPDINLRVALVAQPDLFYPARVRRYLRRSEANHYRCNGFASIAFALGTVADGVCTLLVMQSDLAYRSPSYVRDHFRGWRKVLFTGVVARYQHVCQQLLLPSAKDVHACRPRERRSLNPPAAWYEVYDRTATDFHLTPLTVSNAINIQILHDLEPVMCQQFYWADPRSVIGGRYEGHQHH